MKVPLKRKIRTFLAGIAGTVTGLPEAVRMASASSYFPESPRKTYPVRLLENIAWDFKNHGANTFYGLYGLDVVGSDASNFVPEFDFWHEQFLLNKRGSAVQSQVILLRDKLLFDRYMRANGLPAPEVFAVVRDGRLLNRELEEIPASELKQEKNYFVKDINGQCASFVKRVRDFEQLTQMLPTLNGSYIIQRAVQQHREMNRLNPGAINTLRIVTVLENGHVRLFTSLLRIGNEKTGNVDNWAAGGIAIGIQDDGYLKPYGFYKPHYGRKTDRHPDTSVVFSEFRVPFYEQAVEMACKAHKFFWGIHSIGWDIAITEDGPVFIEGNDNWEISLQQACDRPLKAEWEKSVRGGA